MPDSHERTGTSAMTLVVGAAILLVGAVIFLSAVSQPAYEATAEFTIGSSPSDSTSESLFPEDRPRPTDAVLEREQEFLRSTEVLQLAASLLVANCQGCTHDSESIRADLTINALSGADGFEIAFRADDPTIAQHGANSVVEAYQRIRTTEPAIGSDFEITSVSPGQEPTTRNDRLRSSHAIQFLGASALVLLVAWAWSRVAAGSKPNLQGPAQ